MHEAKKQWLARASVGISRREFLQRGVAVAAAASIAGTTLGAPPKRQGETSGFTAEVADDVQTGMPYIGIPACQIRISRVIMGPAPESVQTRMIQYGCNYLHKVDGCGSQEFLRQLDWDFFYCDVVIDKLNRDEVIQEFERRRGKAGLDVIHFFKIHATLRRPEDLQNQPGLLEAFQVLRDQGKTKWLATSLHAGADMVEACVESGLFTQIQIPFNPATATPEMKSAVAKAHERGIGIISMKPLMGGPAKWENNPQARQVLQNYWPEGTSAAQAVLRWNLAQPGITAVVPKCDNTQFADEACAAAGAQLQAWEREGVEALALALCDSYCRFCRTCEHVCPQGLPISDILRYRMYAVDYAELAGARTLYRSLPGELRADRCNDCGACETACPYGLRVSAMVHEAHQLLV
jgi:predicted aldo/keto reductase-like oxidoreductase